jgi:hypothetical protein
MQLQIRGKISGRRDCPSESTYPSLHPSPSLTSSSIHPLSNHNFGQQPLLLLKPSANMLFFKYLTALTLALAGTALAVPAAGPQNAPFPPSRYRLQTLLRNETSHGDCGSPKGGLWVYGTVNRIFSLICTIADIICHRISYWSRSGRCCTHSKRLESDGCILRLQLTECIERSTVFHGWQQGAWSVANGRITELIPMYVPFWGLELR